jgi:glucokinase
MTSDEERSARFRAGSSDSGSGGGTDGVAIAKPSGSRHLLAGVDVGGSKIAVLVVDADLGIRGRYVAPTEIGSDSRAVEQIAEALDAALVNAGASPADLDAIGVGVPGRVDPQTGSVTLAVNLGWHDLPLGPWLRARYGVPVALENDVRAAAAGLHDRGVVGDEDLAYLSIGTGISAGVVLDGRLHRGVRGLAGEIGHVVLEADGALCACGLRGCFEAVAAGPAINRLVGQAVASGRHTSLDRSEAVHATDVFEHAAAGDPVALEITETVGRHVAHAIHELVMTYDVRRVVLGGGVSTAGPAFMAPINRALDRLRDASELAREVLPDDVAQLLPGGSDAGVWGAVVLARAASTAAHLEPTLPALSAEEPAVPAEEPAITAEEAALRR